MRRESVRLSSSAVPPPRRRLFDVIVFWSEGFPFFILMLCAMCRHNKIGLCGLLYAVYANNTQKNSMARRLNDEGPVVVSLALPGVPDDGRLEYAAAAPPTRISSTQGYGIPYHSTEQAFHATPNAGALEGVAAADVVVRLPAYPSAYFTDSVSGCFVEPSLHWRCTIGGARVAGTETLSRAIPYRSSVYRFRTPWYPAASDAPAFRVDALQPGAVERPTLTSQEALLRARAYPESYETVSRASPP